MLLRRPELEQRIAAAQAAAAGHAGAEDNDRPGDAALPALLILDVANIRVGPYLDTLMPELADRAAAHLRPDDVISLVGDDQLGILATGRTRADLDTLAARLREVFDTPVDCGGRPRRLHGTVVWVAGRGDLLWQGLQANAAAVEEMHRSIFMDGIWGMPGFSHAHTLEDVIAIVEPGSRRMEAVAFELVVHGRRLTWDDHDPGPDTVTRHLELRVAGRVIGHATWWYPARATTPAHAQLATGLGSALSETVQRILEVQHITDQAARDPLTGLLNRRGGQDAVARLEVPYAVGVIDVDDFKDVNTRLGHPGGDQVLTAVAGLLADTRGSDLAVRWGGEEFVLVLPGETIEGAVARLERLLDRCFAEVRAGDRPVSFSCGVASVATGTSLADAVAAADPALRHAKAAGKARILVA